MKQMSVAYDKTLLPLDLSFSSLTWYKFQFFWLEMDRGRKFKMY